MAAEAPFRFLVGTNGLPWRPTRAWAIQDINGGSDLGDWTLTHEEPPPDVPSYPLHDLKRWLLFGEALGEKETRLWTLDPDPKLVDARIIHRDLAGERYLRGLLPEDRTDSDRLSVLMPAIRDDDRRRRYVRLLRKAFPNARVLPEPEMVVEYFRLVRRELTLATDRNNVVLVVDIGASTTDLSVILSRKSGEVLDATTGRARPGRLQAIPGTSSDKAGQWVDEQLTAHLGLELPSPEEDHPARLALLAAVERAKIEVSRGQSTSTVRGATLDRTALEEAALSVVGELEDQIAAVRDQLWAQLTSTDYALEQSREVREDRGVKAAEDALRLVDFVLLAGGASLLPGFREAVEVLFDTHQPKILEVGDSFPVAAAVGALAHVLYRYSPSRIRSAQADDMPPLRTLRGALDRDIHLEWKRFGQADNKAKNLTLLEAGDPIVVEGGERLGAGTLPVQKGKRARVRWVPDQAAKGETKGVTFQTVEATSDDPDVGFKVNQDRVLRLRSSALQNHAAVFVDLKRFEKHDEAANQTWDGRVPKDMLALDNSDELVIDFGMSKTVVLEHGVGVFHRDDLVALCQGRTPKAYLPAAVDPKPGSRVQRPDAATDSDDSPSGRGDAASTPDGRSEPMELPPDTASTEAPSGDVEDTHETPTEAAPASTAVGVPPATTVSDDERSTDAKPDSVATDSSNPSRGTPLHEAQGRGTSAETEVSKDADDTTEADADDGAPPGDAPNPEAEEAAESEESVGGGQPMEEPSQGAPPPRPLDPSSWLDAFEAFLTAAADHGVDVEPADLLMTLMAVTVRPVVFLSGPPGCGKSMLARMVGHLMGCWDNDRFHEVPVQAHWRNDRPLFGKKGLLTSLLKPDQGGPHLVLFDEVNLTRPEYYLARFFHAVDVGDSGSGKVAFKSPVHAIGTLNVDDTSRPPSPKVVDRCLLVEVEPQPLDRPVHNTRLRTLRQLPKLPGHMDPSWADGPLPGDAEQPIQRVQKLLFDQVQEHGLRSDLLPSRRARTDIQRLLALHARLGERVQDYLTTTDLHDRLIASRLLVKVSGAASPLAPLLDQLKALAKQGDEATLRRTKRRIKLFEDQRALGFVSPWQ